MKRLIVLILLLFIACQLSTTPLFRTTQESQDSTGSINIKTVFCDSGAFIDSTGTTQCAKKD